MLTAIVGAAGSLVLRRMDRRGTSDGLVRAKKHGTKSGTGAPLRRGFFHRCESIRLWLKCSPAIRSPKD